MTKRIEYLDAIKGFAIFLMVFAHIIAWSFDDWRTVMYPVVNTPSIINAGLIWHFVYAFHMALFFMVSGYLTYKPIQGPNSGGGILLAIKKKTTRLLIPYFVTGGLIMLIRPGFGYWFLFSLWELSIIGVLINWFLATINKMNNLMIDVFVVGFLYYFLVKFFSLEILKNPVVDVQYGMTFYLPFMFGMLLRKYPNVEEFVGKNYSLVVILFLLCFISKYIVSDYKLIKYVRYVISITHSTEIFGSMTFYYLFKQGVNVKWGNVLSYLGKHTFEIYILHVFFAVRIVQVGGYWLNTNLPTCLATQIVYASCATIVAIAVSLIIASFIKHSKLISKLMFGQ